MSNPPRIDVVGIFDENLNQVFRLARPIRATVSEDSKLMEHPVEDGSIITDHQIILPIEIRLSLILDPEEYRNIYGLMKQSYLRSELFIVRTRTATYTNMIIKSLPHEEDAAIYDTIAMSLLMKEVQIVEAQFGTLPPEAVANQADTDIVDGGEQSPQNQSAAAELLSNIGGLF